MAAIGPAFIAVTERFAPSFSGRGAYPPMFRLSVAVGVVAGLGLVYQNSCSMINPTYPLWREAKELTHAYSEIPRCFGERA